MTTLWARLKIWEAYKSCNIPSTTAEYFDDLLNKKRFKKKSVYENVTDNNERMAFLRATAINKLVDCVSNVFVENYDSIMSGDFSNSLVSHLPDFEKNALP